MLIVGASSCRDGVVAKGVAMPRDRRYPSDLADAGWALIEPRLVGLAVLRVRWVDSVTPIRAGGAKRPAWVQSALDAFHARQVRFAGLDTQQGITVIFS